jgi:hypothetical protein
VPEANGSTDSKDRKAAEEGSRKSGHEGQSRDERGRSAAVAESVSPELNCVQDILHDFIELYTKAACP